MAQYMLTTYDNPYNPFDDFTKWFLWDTEKGYNSCAFLARVAVDSDSLSEDEENEAISEAIDSIIACDFRNIYCKVKENNGKLEFVDTNRENAFNSVNAAS